MGISKRLNEYSKNEDGSVSMHVGDYKVIIDADDVWKAKTKTWRVKNNNGRITIITNKNTKKEGKWHNTCMVLSRMILNYPENAMVKFNDKNPLNCRRSNLRVV